MFYFREKSDFDDLETLIKNLFPPNSPYSAGRPASSPTEGQAKSPPHSTKKGKRRTKRR